MNKSLSFKILPDAPVIQSKELKNGDTILVEVRGQTTTAQVWSKKNEPKGYVSFLVDVDCSGKLVDWIVREDELVNIFTIEMAKAVLA